MALAFCHNNLLVAVKIVHSLPPNSEAEPSLGMRLVVNYPCTILVLCHSGTVGSSIALQPQTFTHTRTHTHTHACTPTHTHTHAHAHTHTCTCTHAHTHTHTYNTHTHTHAHTHTHTHTHMHAHTHTHTCTHTCTHAHAHTHTHMHAHHGSRLWNGDLVVWCTNALNLPFGCYSSHLKYLQYLKRCGQ